MMNILPKISHHNFALCYQIAQKINHVKHYQQKVPKDLRTSGYIFDFRCYFFSDIALENIFVISAEYMNSLRK